MRFLAVVTLAAMANAAVMQLAGHSNAVPGLETRESCTPGAWRCQGAMIFVCSGVGDWLISAVCINSVCCKSTGTNAYCSC